MKQKSTDPRSILTDALHSLAVAIAVVLLVHLVFWIAAQGVTAADGLGDQSHVLDSD